MRGVLYLIAIILLLPLAKAQTIFGLEIPIYLLIPLILIVISLILLLIFKIQDNVFKFKVNFQKLKEIGIKLFSKVKTIKFVKREIPKKKPIRNFRKELESIISQNKSNEEILNDLTKLTRLFLLEIFHIKESLTNEEIKQKIKGQTDIKGLSERLAELKYSGEKIDKLKIKEIYTKLKNLIDKSLKPYEEELPWKKKEIKKEEHIKPERIDLTKIKKKPTQPPKKEIIKEIKENYEFEEEKTKKPSKIKQLKTKRKSKPEIPDKKEVIKKHYDVIDKLNRFDELINLIKKDIKQKENTSLIKNYQEIHYIYIHLVALLDEKDKIQLLKQVRWVDEQVEAIKH
ncbi:hypothetical protein K8R47_02930 [archaeon]|nr:hypothetical protein [archaeon]